MSAIASDRLGPIEAPPGQSGVPYVLQSLSGELIYIPCSKSITRLAVTGKETDNAFAIVGTGGAAGDPIGFHFHREAHDVFLCLKGNVNVWANDRCRTLGVGDFASVPPNTIHQYQILGDYTEFLGLIIPGGWEEFFRFIGEPYDGPLFPLTDERNFFEALLPKLKMAAEKFDMVPVPNHPSASPEPSAEGEDTTLPGSLAPYFLRAGTGPRQLFGGIVNSLLAGVDESAGKFSVGSIESSSMYGSCPLSKNFTFHNVDHVFYLAEGGMSFFLDEKDHATLTCGQTIYIPRGRSFSLTILTRYAKAYVFTSGQGIPELLAKAGKPFHQSIIPPKEAEWEMSSLQSYQSQFKFVVQ